VQRDQLANAVCVQIGVTRQQLAQIQQERHFPIFLRSKKSRREAGYRPLSHNLVEKLLCLRWREQAVQELADLRSRT